VLPGFAPDSKIKMLVELKDEAEIIIAINSGDIEKNKVRGDLGITYDLDVLRLIDAFRGNGLFVGSVVMTRYKPSELCDAFRNKLLNLGIKVYTIGVGSRDKAPMPAYDPFGNMTYVMADVEIDEALLREIAAKTNGQYFRASDNKALKEIYAQINELEKSKVEITHYTSYNELYMGWLLLALILLAAEFLMARMVLNRLPM
jgi:hypothetical protein